MTRIQAQKRSRPETRRISGPRSSHEPAIMGRGSNFRSADTTLTYAVYIFARCSGYTVRGHAESLAHRVTVSIEQGSWHTVIGVASLHTLLFKQTSGRKRCDRIVTASVAAAGGLAQSGVPCVSWWPPRDGRNMMSAVMPNDAAYASSRAAPALVELAAHPWDLTPAASVAENRLSGRPAALHSWLRARDTPPSTNALQRLPPDERLLSPVTLLQLQHLPSPGCRASQSLHASQQAVLPSREPRQAGAVLSAYGRNPRAWPEQPLDGSPPALSFSGPRDVSRTIDRPAAADREGVNSGAQEPEPPQADAGASTKYMCWGSLASM